MTNITIELPGLSDWLDAMKARNDGVEKNYPIFELIWKTIVQ